MLDITLTGRPGYFVTDDTVASARPFRTLNLGSGKKHINGATSIDIVPETEPDIVHDLNQRPWPLRDSTFERVYAHDVIEHLHDIVATMEEIHRVCLAGAIVEITVPHFSSSNAFTDPTHRHYFGRYSFSYFTGEHQFSFYTNLRFRSISTQIVFHPSLFNKIVWRLANRFPEEFERRWAWIFPAWFLVARLEVCKSESPSAAIADIPSR